MAALCRLLATFGFICPAVAVELDMETLYMSDTCRSSGQQQELTLFQLQTTGSRSTLTLRSRRADLAPRWNVWDSCTSNLLVTSPPGSRITVAIEDLDMRADPKENYCIDFLDVHPLDSLVSRFCGSLDATYPTTYASVDNRLRFKWNFYTASPDSRGFTVLLTAFTKPAKGNCTTAGSASPSDALFLCDNGRCIDARWHCDKRDNCGDASDEKGCRDEDSTLATLSICVCVAVVVVSGLLVTAVWMKFKRPPSRGAAIVGGPMTAYSIAVGPDNSNRPPYGHQPESTAASRSSINRY
ncbi:uncharacterized protein [Dermacentor andersoni]|uniref:uncharacterized protein isoform X2 n=1 Tax=Dermacentor andersoni TaxID=34620 RepID=UPI002155C448|nr:uncharacterized protein LOC126544654 isoform X2 [Dermacentor andersoni]